jgi:hypothetical protein
LVFKVLLKKQSSPNFVGRLFADSLPYRKLSEKWLIVSGRSKPASPGRIKTSQFEGIIISQGPHQNETLTGEPSQIEPATIDINSAPGGMVQPGHCA